MHILIIIIGIVLNIGLLFPNLAKAQSVDREQEFYDGVGSAGWNYEDEEEDEEIKPAKVVKRKKGFELKSSPNEFFGIDNISVVDGQVSRSDLEDKIKKNLKQ